MIKARVYKSTGSRYSVKTDAGMLIQVRMKGRLKIEGSTSTNPVAVGDWVMLENTEDPENTMIADILPRHNYINRVSPHSRFQHHIVAANLDQTILFATVKDPKTSDGFIDRFLVTAEAYHVPAVLVINKTDLLKKKDAEKLAEWKQRYGEIGYPVVNMSMQTGEGVDELIQLLKDKISLLSGHSGVGKSTFINWLFPDLQLRTKEVSEWSGKGLHTTTFAEMFDLPTGGHIIDTPGIREMGLVDMRPEELSHYFPEMRNLLKACKFNNCMHIHEPDCAIKNAVASNGISIERYGSYLNILDSLPKEDYS
jgi:ribosome biogenesis GTPase